MNISSPFIKKVLSKLHLFKDIGQFFVGLLFLCSLFFLAQYILQGLGSKTPPALLGIACLFLFLIYYKCVPRAIALSAKPMLAHMSLFFIPAIVAIINFRALIYSHALALILGIVVCTLLSLALTALLASWLMPADLIKSQTKKRSPQNSDSNISNASD